MDKKSLLVLLSLLLAVGAPLLNALVMNHRQETYPTIRVDIEPHDPRDLLYGRYMTFTTKWNWKDGQAQYACISENCCLCVGEGDVNPPVSLTSCPAAPETDLPHCRHVLKRAGRSFGANFDSGVNRYYVDENIALPLEQLFRSRQEKFSLTLHIAPDGRTSAGELYVGDMPLKEYLVKKGGRIPVAQP